MIFHTGGALRALLLGASASVLVPSLALADPAPAFPDLLRQAQTAPRLKEAQASIGQAEGLARQSRALPNPTVNVTVENFGGNGPYSGSQSAETTAAI